MPPLLPTIPGINQESINLVGESFQTQPGSAQGHRYLALSAEGQLAMKDSRADKASFKEITAIVQDTFLYGRLTIAEKEQVLNNYKLIKNNFESKPLSIFKWIFYFCKQIQIKTAENFIQRAQQEIALGKKPRSSILFVAQETISLESLPTTKLDSRKSEITKLLGDKGVNNKNTEFFAGKATNQKDLEDAIEFIKTLPKKGDDCDCFVETDIKKNGQILKRGWHKQEIVSAFSGESAADKKKRADTVKKILALPHVGNAPPGRSLKGSISVPAFSNGHDDIYSKETPVIIKNPMTSSKEEVVNSEYGYQFDKYNGSYLLAQAWNDQHSMTFWREKSEAVLKAANEGQFKTNDPNGCQSAGRSEWCPINGYESLPDGAENAPTGYLKISDYIMVREGSEAHFWETSGKVAAMHEAVEAKLRARPDLVLRLLATGDRAITFIKPDIAWGTGLNGEGADYLGIIYEICRYQLQRLTDEELLQWYSGELCLGLSLEGAVALYVEKYPQPTVKS